MRSTQRPVHESRGHLVHIAMIGVGLLALGGLAVALLTGCSRLPDPSVESAKGRDQTTFIYDRNGAVIATLHSGQNRVDRKLARIPEALRHAVVATEDKRFYEHNGVDPLGVLRAVFANASSGGAAQGGSTITQQYVKNAFFTQEKTMTRKFQEAMLAREIERKYGKDQILELYLNTIYFGHGAYGVEAAAQAYFGRGVENLSLAESALLAGIIKSPGHYSPYIDKAAAKQRRDLVLGLMLQQGYITQEEHDDAVAKPVLVSGLKREASVAPYFVEYVKERLVQEYGPQVVFRGGLRVKTTLDMRAQKAAERAVASQLDQKDDPSAALVAIKPGTGEIRALVGGRDFNAQQFNVATQGRRQPGSAFKPFVLATALANDVNPEQLFSARATTIDLADGPWKVSGSENGSSRMRLRRATEKSINAVFARLIVDLGPDKVVDMAHDLGITSKITPVPAIALGGHREGVSPLEMANAYATLAAGGRKATPFGISKVTDASGKVWLDTTPAAEQALDPAVAYLTTDVLRGVIENGTGTTADIGRAAAGKTGTTQEYRDAWFVGYTPDLAAAVWVGYPEAQREMTSVHGRRVTGGSFPAAIWRDFMRDALAKTPEHGFRRPAGLVEERVCSATGKVANDACPETFGGLFLKDTVPDRCTLHRVPPKAKVPDVIGLTQDEALQELKRAGFTGQVTEVPMSDVSGGLVAEQDPVAGTMLVKGSVVRITVATEPAISALEAFIDGPDQAKVGQALTYYGTGSVGDISAWNWEWGDGASSSGASVSHAYSAPGLYTVKLTVMGPGGVTNTAIQQVRIK